MQALHERQILGGALVILGLSMAGAAAVAGLYALDHMAMPVAMCGPTLEHCIQCVAATSLFVAALGVSGSGLLLIRSASRTGSALQRAA